MFFVCKVHNKIPEVSQERSALGCNYIRHKLTTDALLGSVLAISVPDSALIIPASLPMLGLAQVRGATSARSNAPPHHLDCLVTSKDWQGNSHTLKVLSTVSYWRLSVHWCSDTFGHRCHPDQWNPHNELRVRVTYK
jgi:hypothetical protein